MTHRKEEMGKKADTFNYDVEFYRKKIKVNHEKAKFPTGGAKPC